LFFDLNIYWLICNNYIYILQHFSVIGGLELSNISQDKDSRRIFFAGRTKSYSLILKLYNLYYYDKAIDFTLLRESKEFLEREIMYGHIEPHSGLGFAVISEDMLAVKMGAIERPYDFQFKIYGFEEGDFGTIKPTIPRDGHLSDPERRIVKHEIRAWLEYVESGQDKEKYLSNVLKEDYSINASKKPS
jgi:hypothetical protein